MCVDNENNLFVTSEKFIYKVTPAGAKILYGQMVQPGSKLIITPDGAMVYNYLNYVLKTDTTVFDPDVAKPTTDLLKAGGQIKEFVYDSNKNLHVICRSAITTIDVVNLTELSNQEFEDWNFNTGRIYNGTLYLIAEYIGTEADKSTGPYLLKIGVDAAAGALSGDIQEVYNFSEIGYSGIKITAMDVTASGGLYLGTTTNAMLTSTTIEAGVFEDVFPQILGEHMIYTFKWSNEEYVFINTRNSNDDTKTTILKLMVFEESADHYGRN
jgi:hypothetical protein